MSFFLQKKKERFEGEAMYYEGDDEVLPLDMFLFVFSTLFKLLENSKLLYFFKYVFYYFVFLLLGWKKTNKNILFF